MTDELAGIVVLFLVMWLMPLTGLILLNYATIETRKNDSHYYSLAIKYPLILLSLGLLCLAAGFFSQELFENAYSFYKIGFFVLILFTLLYITSESYYNFKSKNRDELSYNATKSSTQDKSTSNRESVKFVAKFIVSKTKETYDYIYMCFALMAIVSIYSILANDVLYFTAVQSFDDLLNLDHAMIFEFLGKVFQLIISVVILFVCFKKRMKENTDN